MKIPLITSEFDIKLYDSRPTSPILRYCKKGRFLSSNSPLKPEKLYSPMSIDVIDSQFSMWNDLTGGL